MTSTSTRRAVLAGAAALPVLSLPAIAAGADPVVSSQALPSGVTLQQIDGGSNYYSANGFTYAANAGWDSPSFFPIGLWLAPMISQANANRWHDLNLNTAFLMTGNSNISLLRSNGFSYIAYPADPGRGGIGNETVGLLSADENWEASVAQIASTPNNIQDYRPWWLQCTYTPFAFKEIDGTPMPAIMRQPHPTPNGTTRHFNIFSADTYWFIGGHEATHGIGSMGSQGGQIYNIGRDLTADECAHGSRYGDMIDIARIY